MTRRQLLKFLLTTPLAATLDYEKMLWIPGQQVVVPTVVSPLTTSQIVAMELERIIPQLKMIFERDDVFYKAIKSRQSVEFDRTPIFSPITYKPRK